MRDVDPDVVALGPHAYACRYNYKLAPLETGAQKCAAIG